MRLYCKLLLLFLLTWMGNIHSKADNVAAQKVIVKVAKNIQDKDYVAGYKRLLLFKDLFSEQHEKFLYHIYRAQVLHQAIRESDASEFRDDYVLSLKFVADYYLKHQYVYQSVDKAFCWSYLRQLSDVLYESGNNDELQQLAERVCLVFRDSEMKRSEDLFHITMNYYLVLMKRRLWGIAGLHANKIAFLLADGKADVGLIGRSFEYASLGSLIQSMGQDNFPILEGMTCEMMSNALTAFRKQKDGKTTKDYVLQLGYQALLNQLKGKSKEAVQCIEKEERMLREISGLDSATEAWMLFQQSLKDEAKGQRNAAVDKMERAYTMMFRCKHFDRVRRELMTLRYERMYEDDMTWGGYNNRIKSQEYYINQLLMVHLSAMSNQDKLIIMDKNMAELSILRPFPIDLYLKYVIKKIDIQRAIPTNEEFVALPSDYDALKSDDSNTDMLNLIMTEGNKGIAKLELRSAIQILKTIGGNTNEALASIQLQLGEMLVEGKEYKDALKVLLDSQNLWGKNDNQLIGRLHSQALMAKCFQMLNEYDRCNLMLKRLEEEKNKVNAQSMHTVGYVSLLNYMADVYVELGENKKAEACLDGAVNLSKNSFLLLNQSFKASYSKALLLYANGDYRKCADLLMKVCPVDRNMINFELYYAIMIKSLCKVNDIKAIYFYKEFTRRSLDEILPIFISNQSQFGRDVMWAYKSAVLMQLSAEVCASFPDKDLVSLAFDNTLFCKSLDLRMNECLRQFVNSTEDNYTRSLYMDMLDAQDSLHYASKKEVMRYKNRISFAQEQLLAAMVEEQKKTNTLISYTQIFSRLLGEKMALVEYSMYERDGENYYCAYVMKKGLDSPKFVKLCKASDLKHAIGDAKPEEIERLYNTDKLYHLIWKPISDYVDNEGLEYLLITPTGLINRINIDFMQCENSRLSDSFNVIRLTTSASLLNGRKFNLRHLDADAALFGAIKYDMSETEMQEVTSKYPHRNRERLYRTSRGEELKALPFTRVELNEIKEVFAKTPLRVRQYTGKEATEEAFKQFDGCSPIYLHLATHGFYLKDQHQKEKHPFYNDFTAAYYSDKPLLYTGLLMAGASKAWRGEKLPKGIEDGILTADEISRMNLSRTRLVVLSACETALGDIDSTEGVIGLQRAFKKAGADFVVMTLWKVRDDVCTLFMKEFYKALLENKIINKAMRDAALAVKKIYPSASDWAAFVVQK